MRDLLSFVVAFPILLVAWLAIVVVYVLAAVICLGVAIVFILALPIYLLIEFFYGLLYKLVDVIWKS